MIVEKTSDYEYQTLIDMLAEMVSNYMATNHKQNGESMKGVEWNAESSHESNRTA